MDMRGLLAVVVHDVEEKSNQHGPNHFIPIGWGGTQKYEYNLGDGIEFMVQNAEAGNYITWETLSNVVKGLWSYLIVGRRFRQTFFNFWDGLDAPAAILWPLGSGCIRITEMSTNTIDVS